MSRSLSLALSLPPNTLNKGGGFNVAAFPKLSAAVRGAQAGQRSPATIMCLGTSIDRGQISPSSSSTSQALNSWPYKLAAGINAYYGATAESLIGTGGYTYSAFDSRVSTYTWINTSNSFGVNGWVASSAASLVFNPLAPWDTVQIEWNRASGRGVFSVTCGADAPVNINTAGANGDFITKISRPLSSDAITLSWVSGAVIAETLNCYNSANPINVINGAGGGENSSLWNNGGGAATRINMCAQYAPDLTILGGHIVNDWRSSGAVTQAQSQTNIAAMIAAAKLTGDVLVLTGTPTADGVSPSYATQQTFVAGNIAAANAAGVPYYDSFNVLCGATVGGIPGGASDNVHPTATYSAALAAALRPIVIGR